MASPNRKRPLSSLKEEPYFDSIKRRSSKNDEVGGRSRSRLVQVTGNHAGLQGQMHEAINFIINVMMEERLVDSTDPMVIGCSDYRTHWIVEVSTEHVAEQMCYLDGIYYKEEERAISVKRYNGFSSPRFSSWNNYYFHKYKCNDPIVDCKIYVYHQGRKGGITGDHLVECLNQKMNGHGLSDGKPIKSWRNLNSSSFLLLMESSKYAESICYLNRIWIDEACFYIRRPRDWQGPIEKYQTYYEFVASVNTLKTFDHEKQEATSSPPNKVVKLTAIREENKLLKEQIAQEKENKLLQEEISKLSSSNVSRVEEAKRLKTKIEEEKKKLSVRDAQVSQLENDIVNLDSKLDRMNHENHNVLNVKWQEHCSELSAMDEQIDLLKAEFEDLQRQSQEATRSLLEERKERKAVEEKLQQIQRDSVNKPLK